MIGRTERSRWPEYAVGAQIVSRALEEPIRNIVEKAGLEGRVIVEKVKAERVTTRGFDAESLEFVDMIQAAMPARSRRMHLGPARPREVRLARNARSPRSPGQEA